MLVVLSCPDCGAPAQGPGTCSYCGATLAPASNEEPPDAWIARAVASLEAGEFGDAWNLTRRRLPSVDHETRNRMLKDGRIVSLLGAWIDEARAERAAGRKLGAIRLVRQHLRIGLAEAKQLVDDDELNSPDFLYRARARIVDDARRNG
ncbi:MAG: hypothetical protein R3B72_48380 [Polyangiaceae bacterium]